MQNLASHIRNNNKLIFTKLNENSFNKSTSFNFQLRFHIDPKVARSHAKDKCVIVLKCKYLGLQKSKNELGRKIQRPIRCVTLNSTKSRKLKIQHFLADVVIYTIWEIRF